MKKRNLFALKFMSLILLVVLVVIVINSFFISVMGIHLNSGANLKYYADNVSTQKSVLQAKRGLILDSEGNIIGVCDEERLVAGTYLHGIFESEEFIGLFVKSLQENSNVIITQEVLIDKITEYKDNQYDKLAKLFEENINIEKLKEIIDI